MIHLGTKLRHREGGHKLTKDNFISTEGSEDYLSKLTPEQIAKNMERSYWYFDRLMRFYRGLDREAFNKGLTSLVTDFSFTQVTDLEEYKGVEGHYLMVLDEYKQVFKGWSKDIRQSIRAHWSRKRHITLAFTRAIDGSTLSIDDFRALDTTRLYYKPMSNHLALETLEKEGLDSTLPTEYVLNSSLGLGEKERLKETYDIRARVLGLDIETYNRYTREMYFRGWEKCIDYSIEEAINEAPRGKTKET